VEKKRDRSKSPVVRAGARWCKFTGCTEKTTRVHTNWCKKHEDTVHCSGACGTCTEHINLKHYETGSGNPECWCPKHDLTPPFKVETEAEKRLISRFVEFANDKCNDVASMAGWLCIGQPAGQCKMCKHPTTYHAGLDYCVACQQIVLASKCKREAGVTVVGFKIYKPSDVNPEEVLKSVGATDIEVVNLQVTPSPTNHGECLVSVYKCKLDDDAHRRLVSHDNLLEAIDWEDFLSYYHADGLMMLAMK